MFRRESLTADRYIKDILEKNVVLFVPIIGMKFVLMQDNTRPQIVKITIEYLQEVGIQVLDWPAVSPYLNPIELAISLQTTMMSWKMLEEKNGKKLDLENISTSEILHGK